MTTTKVAVCEDCTPAVPVPFGSRRERATWTATHTHATGHLVTWTTLLTEIDGDAAAFPDDPASLPDQHWPRTCATDACGRPALYGWAAGSWFVKGPVLVRRVGLCDTCSHAFPWPVARQFLGRIRS